MRRRVLIVTNPFSRSGGDWHAVAQLLAAHGLDIVDGGDFKALPELLRRHRDRIDCLAVGGGDGSMNAVAPYLAYSDLALGILPMGTANDLARTLGIPADLEAAAGIIAAGIAHRIDLGRVNGKYFFNAAHIGLGAGVMRNVSGQIKRRWKVLSYARGLLKALRAADSFRADIVCDGKRESMRVIQIAVGNGRHYGGGMTVLEDARIDDGCFCFYSVKPAPLWDMFKLAPLLKSGRLHDVQPVACGTGTQLIVTTQRPMAVTADGELITQTPAHFDMCRGAVTVIVPPEYLSSEAEHAATR